MSAIPDYGLERSEAAASVVRIQNHADYERAGEVLVRIATTTKKLREGDPMVDFPGLDRLVASAKKAYDDALETRRFFVDRWMKVRDAYAKAMELYRLSEEQKHQKMLEETAASATIMRDVLERQAEDLFRKGDSVQADAILQQRDLIPEKPQLNEPDFRLKNISQVEEYEVVVTDLKALIQGIASGKVPLFAVVQKKEVCLVEVRTSAIVAAAKSMGDAFDWPGVHIRKGISYRPRAAAQ